MIHYEEMQVNANRNPNPSPNPKGCTNVQQRQGKFVEILTIYYYNITLYCIIYFDTIALISVKGNSYSRAKKRKVDEVLDSMSLLAGLSL